MVEPPPVASKSDDSRRVVVVGVQMSFKDSCELALQFVASMLVALLLTSPVWGFLLFLLVVMFRGGEF